MLGKTAGGLFWMFRYLERSENTARLLEAGFRMALTRSKSAEGEWQSVLVTAGVLPVYQRKFDGFNSANVINFLLRDPDNPSAVMNVMDQARTNARLVRTALSREVWESTNECWMTLKTLLSRPVRERDLPNVLGTIRRQSALVRGALYGTMLRNDIYDFSRLGTFLERADNTARILDVKYYVLLPSVTHVGNSLDNIQWETILRSVSAQRSYRWLNGTDTSPKSIVDFLIHDARMPRSFTHCYRQITENLSYLASEYDNSTESLHLAQTMEQKLKGNSVDEIFEIGLHEFIEEFINANNALGIQIERDYRFQE